MVVGETTADLIVGSLNWSTSSKANSECGLHLTVASGAPVVVDFIRDFESVFAGLRPGRPPRQPPELCDRRQSLVDNSDRASLDRKEHGRSQSRRHSGPGANVACADVRDPIHNPASERPGVGRRRTDRLEHVAEVVAPRGRKPEWRRAPKGPRRQTEGNRTAGQCRGRWTRPHLRCCATPCPTRSRECLPLERPPWVPP